MATALRDSIYGKDFTNLPGTFASECKTNENFIKGFDDQKLQDYYHQWKKKLKENTQSYRKAVVIITLTSIASFVIAMIPLLIWIYSSTNPNIYGGGISAAFGLGGPLVICGTAVGIAFYKLKDALLVDFSSHKKAIEFVEIYKSSLVKKD